eukprot:6698796-Lingulodinium_polyedra.AAC.1
MQHGYLTCINYATTEEQAMHEDGILRTTSLSASVQRRFCSSTPRLRTSVRTTAGGNTVYGWEEVPSRMSTTLD